MSVLETIRKLSNRKQAARETAHQEYEALVNRGARNERKRKDTLENVAKILSDVDKTPEQYEEDVARAKKRAELADIASHASSLKEQLLELKSKKKTVEAQRSEKLREVEDKFAGLVRTIQLNIKNVLHRLGLAESARQELGIDRREQLAKLQDQFREAQEQAARYPKRTIDGMRADIKSAIDKSNAEVNHQRDSKRSNRNYYESLELQKDLEEALKILELPKFLKAQIQRLQRISP